MRKLTSTELQHVYGGGGGCYQPPPCKPPSNHYSQSKCGSASQETSCGSYSRTCAPSPCGS